jgi:hypothetical protein
MPEVELNRQKVTDPDLINMLNQSLEPQPEIQTTIAPGEKITDPKLIEQLEAQPAQEPQETGFIGEVKGALETGATILSGAIAEPLSGLSGAVVAPVATPEQTQQVVDKTADALTYDPKTPEGRRNLQVIAKTLQPVGEILEKAEKVSGDAGFDLAGPIGGAITSALPAAVLELLGIVGVRKLSKVRAPEAAVVDNLAPEISVDQAAPVSDIEGIADDLKAGNTESVAGAAQPDPEILAAAEELEVDLPAGASSTNQAFIETEQGLKSRPGSLVSTVEQKAIRDLGERADNLVNDLGGTTDRALLDSRLADNFQGTVDSLTAKSNALYKAVDEAVNPAATVEASNVQIYLSQKLRELGGDKSLLTGAERRLQTLISDGKTPTYAALERVRKNVGEGFSRRGIFADDEIGTLKQVYGALITDQQAAAKRFGVNDQFKAANDLVSKRKGVEDNIVKLYGKDFRGSFIAKLNTAASSLTKGDVSQLKKLMDSVPDNLRGEVAATMLNDLFAAGTRNRSGLGGGFAKAYEGLNRNPTAKTELFRHLPEGAQRRFDLIGKVTTGLYRAKAFENKSKTARDVIAALDDGGLLSKLYLKSGGKAAVSGALGVVAGFPEAGAALAAGSFIMDRIKKQGPAGIAADELLASPEFSRALKAAAVGREAKAEALITKSDKYEKWYKYTSKTDRDQITKKGFLGWLIASSTIPKAGEDE